LTRTTARTLALLLTALATFAAVAKPALADRDQPGRLSLQNAASSDSDERPNIVLVLVDDMRTDELRFMDDTLRLMNGEGVFFPNAISPHPLCCPARAELVSGQYAQNNGVQHNSGRYGGLQALRQPEETVPVWMQRAGYQTAWLGKYLNGYKATLEPGWTEWKPLVGSQVSHYTSYQFYGEPPVIGGYITDAIEEKTVETIDEFSGPGEPFFMVVNHTAPHPNMTGSQQSPPVPAPEYGDYPVTRQDLGYILDKPSFNKRTLTGLPPLVENTRRGDRTFILEAVGRIRALQSVDDYMETLVATLADRGELDNTWIVFASDNGFMLGEHTLIRKNYLIRESLDVPLVVRGPGVADPGSTSQRTVSLVDLPKTFLDIAGAQETRAIDGLSLLPTLASSSAPWRDTTLVQTGSSRTSGRNPGWEYRGVQTSRYLLAINMKRRGGNYLFDREKDPYERRNVIDSGRYRPVVEELRRRYRALANCNGVFSCNRVFGPAPRPLPKRHR
jgi:N-acetylglucosamine-6-sulfatase